MNIKNSDRIKKRADIILILCFLSVVWLPLIDTLFSIEPEFEKTEKRKLADLPQFSISKLFDFNEKMNEYYDDNFGFRDTLIKANNFLKAKVLSVSANNKVLIGKEGWLFFAKGEENIDAVEYYRGIRTFSEGDLINWKNKLEERHRILAEKGIVYIFFVAPNKHTIYPEYLPDYLTRDNQETMLDKFLSYMKNNSSLKVIDLKAPLLKEKKHHLLYYKADTHWNQYGAFIASQEINKELIKHFPDIVQMKKEDFKISYRDRHRGDLSNMLSLNHLFTEKMVIFSPKNMYKAKGDRIVGDIEQNRMIIRETNNSKLPRALFLRDSFGVAMIPFLSESFERIKYLKARNLNIEYILRDKPDVVIEEMVERFFMLPASNTPYE